jgi:hypothetical protein
MAIRPKLRSTAFVANKATYDLRTSDNVVFLKKSKDNVV